MVRTADPLRSAVLLGFGCVLGTAGCTEDVSLGRWARRAAGPAPSDGVAGTSEPGSSQPSASEGSGGAGDEDASAQTGDGSGELADSGTGGPSNTAGGDAGAPAPECLVGLGTGKVSPLTTGVGVTETSTDWNLPEPTTGFEWTLTIERDVPMQSSASGYFGYYWHNQFSFLPGATGIVGLQTNGVYQAQPTDAPEYVHMAVFWLSGSPLEVELGDIAYPDARIGTATAAGVTYRTIHAKFPHEVCHPYRFRFDVDATDEVGNQWYGLWITDETTDQVTLLGRMLMPVDAGLISTFSTSRTSPLWFTAQRCSELLPASALFSAPRASSGQRARRVADRFSKSYGCNPSLIADFEDAVRHESFVER